MKKLISLLIISILSFVSFFGFVSAENNKEIFVNNSIKNNFYISDNSFDDYQTMGWKSWIIGNGMRTISFIMKQGDDFIEFYLDLAKASNKSAIIKNKNKIADTLDKIADNFDYVGKTVRLTVYEQLKAQGFSHSIAWNVSLIIDVISF